MNSALPDQSIDLPERVVHAWTIRLDCPEGELQLFEDILAPDELEIANRFHQKLHRRRYVVSRANLRQLLSCYTALPAERISFGYEHKGKPYLNSGRSGQGPNFNLSYSEDRALVAVARNAIIGVDLERCRDLDDMDSVAESCFAPREMQTLSRLPETQRIEGFYNCWTRKEAFIKALGEGLGYPLKSFVVSLSPEEAPAILNVDGDSAKCAQWQVFSPTVAASYICAVVVQGEHWKLSNMGIFRAPS
jgi:4'-phosphopantetheinyl transferase